MGSSACCSEALAAYVGTFKTLPSTRRPVGSTLLRGAAFVKSPVEQVADQPDEPVRVVRGIRSARARSVACRATHSGMRACDAEDGVERQARCLDGQLWILLRLCWPSPLKRASRYFSGVIYHIYAFQGIYCADAK